MRNGGRLPRPRHAAIAVLALVLVLATAPSTAQGSPGGDATDPVDAPSVAPSTERVSVASDASETIGIFGSEHPAISADGNFVAFHSREPGLVLNDTNGVNDVFVHHRPTGVTERASISTGGTQGSGSSSFGDISADGRYVTFSSQADNLVVGDTNDDWDVFVRDRQAGTTERVSVGSDGTEGNFDSWEAVISDDGQRVAFASQATNLVADDTNSSQDVFVHDRQDGTTERVSVDSGETQANATSGNPSISADGHAVAFNSIATNLVAGDSNGSQDVFVRDRQADTTDRVSVATGGTQGGVGTSQHASISSDGRYVAFGSSVTDLVIDDTNGAEDVFVHDRQAGATQRVSTSTAGDEGTAPSYEPTISADGRYVAFGSLAANLVDGDGGFDGDVLLRDRQAGTTELVSISSDGDEGDDSSEQPAISADGRYVAFDSFATNLVDDDTNASRDAFVRDRGTSGPAPAGQLRVTTTPAVPAQIIVDGVPRDSWGLTWVDFPVGMHEVCFGPVPGFTPPPCEQVEVLEDQSTVVEGTYGQRGTLRVLTDPAVPSTITIDGQPANDWGVWTDLDPGEYEVCFGAVADMLTPPCQTANVAVGNLTEITGSFTADPGAPGPSGHGYLRATTDPAVASRITIDGQVADTWGLTWLKLAPGDYEVCFEGVVHTTAPDCETVEVSADQTTVAQGDFGLHGFLKVNTSPAVGATITVDGQPANAWGVWTSLEPGTYQVCYGPLDGLDAPPCEDAAVTAGNLTEITGTYT